MHRRLKLSLLFLLCTSRAYPLAFNKSVPFHRWRSIALLRTASVCIQSLGRYVYRVIYINVLFIPPCESTAFYLNWYILMHAFPIQLPLLLVKQLEALEMFTSVTLPLPTSPALSPTVECLLANQLKVLPPGQCVDILESLCQYFQEKCLPKLQTHGGVARKRKTKKGRQTLSEYDTGTTGGGLDCLVEKFVDIFGIVISHIPLETFMGRFGERALALLQRLHSGVCLPFLEACPSLVSSMKPIATNLTVLDNIYLIYLQPSDFHSSLCCACLHLVCKCCQLQACLRAVFPDLLQPEWMLDQLCQLSSGRVVPRCWKDLSGALLIPQCNYLLVHTMLVEYSHSLRPPNPTLLTR